MISYIHFFIEVIYLTIVPVLYSTVAGLALIKILNCNFINGKKSIFAPPLGVSFCSALQLIILKFQLVPYAQQTYFAFFLLFCCYTLQNKFYSFSLNKEMYIKSASCVIIFIIIFLFQRFTIGWGIVPLKFITESGFGMDDTAWHASIAAMFKNSIPIPHPTLSGEYLPPSHRMIHCIAAFFSILLDRNSLDIFFFTIPALVSIFLVFQVYSFISILTKSSKSILISSTLFICFGLTGATALLPVFGKNLISFTPEPLPWIFWRLPGLGFSLLFSLPIVLILTKKQGRTFTTYTKYFSLLLNLGAGLFSKPAIPICIIGAYGVYGFVQKTFKRQFSWQYFFTSAVFISAFYFFFLTGKTYGFDNHIPFKPFQTFISVFEKLIEVNNKSIAGYSKIAIFLTGYFLVPCLSCIKAFKNIKNLSQLKTLVLFSGIIGITGFLFLFSPMGAEYQFGLFGIFFLNILFFIMIQYRYEKILSVCLVLSGIVYFIIFSINCFSPHKKVINIECNKRIVEAMSWLNKNTDKNESFFVNDQHYRSKMTNNAVYCALSERQSYISCYRYTPETYINLYRGKPSPWSTRLNNNEKIFNGDFKIMKTESQRFNIKHLVVNKTSESFQNIEASRILSKKFENSRIAIYKINLDRKQQ